jgi:two-component system, OmpR family, heavy metal sensor histidine kinase CusS
MTTTRPWSLAARLTAWYAASAFLLLLVTGIYLYATMKIHLDEEDDEHFANRLSGVREALAKGPGDGDALRIAVSSGQPQEVLVRILSRDGRTLVQSPGMEGIAPEKLWAQLPLLAVGNTNTAEVKSPTGRPYRIGNAEVAGARAGEPPHRVHLALDHSAEFNLVSKYRGRLYLVLGLGFAACLPIGYWIARRGLRPLGRMAEAVQGIHSATLHERIEPAGFPSEIRALAVKFNEMLGRLEDAFTRLSRFSADIAHELRTPVHNLRGEVEVALGRPRSAEEYRQILESSLEECGQISRLIDGLLFLARAENPRTQIARQRIDIGRELATIREFYDAPATDAGIRLRLDLDGADGLCADLDRTLFQRAVGNLIENAMSHTPAGGSVTLAAAAGDGVVRVEVADTGSGIPPEHLPRIFDRFYRVDEGRSKDHGGMGLGLAITRSVATLHGGTIDVASRLGAGTRVSLTFPVASANGAGAGVRNESE